MFCLYLSSGIHQLDCGLAAPPCQNQELDQLQEGTEGVDDPRDSRRGPGGADVPGVEYPGVDDPEAQDQEQRDSRNLM